MPSRLIFIEFLKNVQSITVNGKQYSQTEFEKAKN